MKLAGILLAMILFIASIINAGSSPLPTTPLANGYTVAAFQHLLAKDSLLTNADSSYIAVNYTFESKGFYVLSCGAATATGDSVKCVVALDYEDFFGNLIAREIVDTLAANTGKQILLPINKTVFSPRGTILIKQYTGASTTKTNLRNFTIMRVIPVTYPKN